MGKWTKGPNANFGRTSRREAVPPPDRPLRVMANGRVYWLDREEPPRPTTRRRVLRWVLARLRK